MKILYETKGNPIFQVGDSVIVNRNTDCPFGWIDERMDMCVGRKYFISGMRWYPDKMCYSYTLKGSIYSWDAGCLTPTEDFPVDNAALDKFFDLFVH